ncbi:MAG TPA: RsmD family RNA methyltransferase [Bacteroidales bacterium]|nr:RsmD family RNA methyltransferase [Bacteroidales bacterium]
MRIISGKYRGKTIFTGKEFQSRPTTDFAKESLFNILANSVDFEDVKVLDLFAGTGGIGFEFASRGSSHVDAVEGNFKHHEFIRKIAKDLQFEGYKAIKSDVLKYIERCPFKYDIVFADPPFDWEHTEELPTVVFGSGILEAEGMLIVEHPKRISFAGNARLFDHRVYGNVHFSFFR